MRSYLRCLECPECKLPCELDGSDGRVWECRFCGKRFRATDDEASRYKEPPRGKELPSE